MVDRPSDPGLIGRLRALCLALPRVEERLSHGEPAWFVADRSFATTADHHHDDRVAVWLAAPAGRLESLVQTDSVRFFRPPYVGVRGWVGVYLDVPVDWEELAALVADAHATVLEQRRSRRR
jgi:predicted DNA-binding protein (MmcQ/YjbR family)